MSQIDSAPMIDAVDPDPETLHGWWLVACEQLRTAYRWWFDADSESRADCYATLTAMIDQEEAAAAAYRRAVKLQAPRFVCATGAAGLVPTSL
jgi:hypothetical protein